MRGACTTHNTDPTIIVPVYSSGIFDDTARLIFCLVIHPIILEFCLHMCRQNAMAEYDGTARAAGINPNNIDSLNQKELFLAETNAPLVVEAILVFNRRFLIG